MSSIANGRSPAGGGAAGTPSAGQARASPGSGHVQVEVDLAVVGYDRGGGARTIAAQVMPTRVLATPGAPS